MKNWKKYLSPLLSTVLLLNVASQTAVPLIAYADTAADETTELNDSEELVALVTTAEELINFKNKAVTIEDIEITAVDNAGELIVYTALTAEDVEFLILDEEGQLGLEVGEIYTSITGVVTETDEGEILIVPASEEDVVVAELTDVAEMEIDEPAEEEEDAVVEDTEDGSEDDQTADETDVEEEGISAFALTDGVDPLQVEEETFDLSLMHMNDTHARVGNYAQMYTAIEGFRAENPEALLFHAGDVFSGTLYFNQFEGMADLAALNLMGIDAMVFGNHEFDLGSPHTALANFVREANFPFLGSNIDFSAEPLLSDLTERGSNPSIYNKIVLNVEGERIGVFGLLTEDTANIASPGSVAFTNYIAAAEEAVAAFEADGINKIIALSHLGFASSPDFGNDIVLAEQVEGIDIIVGGHSHTRVSPPEVVNSGDSPTLIVQAGANAERLGTLNVTFNENGEIVNHSGQLINVLAEDDAKNPVYSPSTVITSAIASFADAVDGISSQQVGAVAIRDITNPRHGDDNTATDSVRANETALGNLVTDAMLAKTKELYPETVIAFQNGGGVRAPISAGPITVGEVINVLPFGNNPVVMDLSGTELKELFEISYSANQRPAGGLEESGGFLHVSGMEIYYDSTRLVGDRIVEMFVDINGQLVPIDADVNYTVTTNAFTAQGGDGLTTLKTVYDAGRVQDTGAIDWEQLRDYMIEEQYLNRVVLPMREGRINDLRGQEIEEFRVAQLRNRMNSLQDALLSLASAYPALLDEIGDLQAQLASLEAALEENNADIAALLEAIRALEARIVALEAELGVEPEPEPEPTPEPTPEPEPTPTTPVPTPDNGDSNGNGGTNGDNGNNTGSNGAPGTPTTRPTEDKGDKQTSLPAAGSNMESAVYAGVTILFAGGALFVISKRKERQNIS